MVKEGYWYGLPLVLAAGALLMIRLPIPAVVLLIFAVLVLNFFRDPNRLIPTDPKAIVSPADGLVVQITEDAHDGIAFQRLSIFMSPLDVHVNRAPIAGAIRDVKYRKGLFRVASKDVASVENEQNVFIITGERGTVVVKQIAGLIARRIVFWKQPGDAVARGERVGMIKFGSRVDVLLEPSVTIAVKTGDRVKAGSSVIAAW
jgi:phosphatidylserine decarboxylase